MSLPVAVAAYYRSQFINLTVPGGVVGDVHRGVSHGRDVRDVKRALRAVAWERPAGQVVQVALTVAVLLVLPSPVRSSMPVLAFVVLALAVGVAILARTRAGAARSAWARFRRAFAGDTRDGLLAPGAWPWIALASAPVSQLLPLALLVLMGMVAPSIAGWGPREGVTAWAFGAAGLGAQRGVATAVVYGIMVLVACLPGAVVLVAGWFRPAQRSGRAPVGRTVHA